MIKKLAVLCLCILLFPSAGYSDNPYSDDSDVVIYNDPSSTSTSDEDLDTAKVETTTEDENKEEVKDEENKEENTEENKEEESSTFQYTVVSGDCLSAIAKKYLGDASRWPELVELNKDKYPSLESNPNLIYVGWVLTVPGKGNSSSTSSTDTSTSTSTSTTEDTTVTPSSDDTATVASGKAPKRAVDSPTGAPALTYQSSPSGSCINTKSAEFKDWFNSAIDTYGDWNMPAIKNKYGQTISVEMYMKAILFIETNGTHRKSNGSLVTSYCGAQGFMQLMPATASELGVDATDPKQNLAGGCKLFQKIFSGSYGTAGSKTGLDKLLLVACSYNAGPWSSLVKGSWQDLKNTGSSVQSYGIKLKMCLGLELEEDEKTYARNNMLNGQSLESYCDTLYSTAQGYGL